MLRSNADFETERVLPFERSVDEEEPAHAGEGWKSKRYRKSNDLETREVREWSTMSDYQRVHEG